MNYWLLKSEPKDYSWFDLKHDIKVRWDGIRNYQARNYMLQMQVGDLGFFYHSGKKPGVIGVIKVISEPYADVNDTRFVAVDIQYHQEIQNNVPLNKIAQNAELNQMKILKQSRLSISPVTQGQWNKILELSIKNC